MWKRGFTATLPQNECDPEKQRSPWIPHVTPPSNSVPQMFSLSTSDANISGSPAITSQ